jgi:serine/threonine-protein kinase HipA
MTTDAANRRVIRKEGYRLLEAFPLPESAWREELYTPLGKRVRKIRNRGGLSPGQEEILAVTEREMEMYERYSSSYGYVMYVMEETGRALRR